MRDGRVRFRQNLQPPFVLSEVEARCATPFDFAQGEREIAYRRSSPFGGPSKAGSKISAQINVQISEIIRILPMLAVPG
jgi:hypothetical protein